MIKPKNKNILILSAGRRVELVQDFKTEAAKISDGLKVFTAELNPAMSSACHVSDGSFVLPRIDDPAYTDRIFELAQAQNTGLIIPTFDTELKILADERERFARAGIHLIVSDSNLVAQCRDKRRTVGLFEKLGIATPEIYAAGALTFPCFAKPYDGSRSIGAKRIMSPDDLTEELLADPKMMFCQYIDNEFDEYTVDLYYDRQGRLKCAVPRQRLEVRSGEVSKGATRRHALYGTMMQAMPKLEGARGCITAQFFYRKADNTLYGVEINPRFGGGYPLTYAAGGNYVGWLIREYLLGEDVPFFDAWENNLIMLRYDAKVLVHEHQA
ncbi:ATP-grasp domain-containing protein [Neisseria chenwenguii]|uniref:Carbamoyl phosphate synthase large subunit n=1 Tax=Neisseria chenwenguii TaxID=1853278 RepID=A0A220S0G3_9NEIS|nr:ATP-grasp domain-containing protein [Neisseria chenwenguii]ASK26856.1 carbamoyl phosphate synthase large subunit [Neisseria chenwenguii]ROV56834.1 ATP-grasp domain-containing protein [Neisseria chenwenguii]